MGKFTLEFNTDNAAFEDDANSEPARILQEVYLKVADGYAYGPCIDVNGNTVGRWFFTD
jgi:hypothetical protein